MQPIPEQNNSHRPCRRRTLPRGVTIAILIGLVAVIAVVGIILDSRRDADASPWDPVSPKMISYAFATNPVLPEPRQTVIDSASDLVGKVRYFWGGKSKAYGWDDNWGKLTEVTSEGSSTTGTMRPMGLDCSGFVTWCFIQTGLSWEEAIAQVGNGTANQFRLSEEIAWAELQPGDFAFQNEPGDPEGNHVGICIGFDRKGEPLFIHCAASENDVVATHADGVFEYARRPMIYAE
ncbi:MAG: C40 family peptidase [Christensenellaceae bacterium]|nr:C40 family peptidase [Christensenellaceae bacterium]